MINFRYKITSTLYESIMENTEKILSFLKHKEIIGRNPQGETTRYFDKAIELVLIESLRKKGFSGKIIGEETGIHEGTEKGIIFIDPLDGSLNAARGIKYYCVALAFLDNENLNSIRAAVVWDIPGNKIYFAEKNYGAYKIINGEPKKLVVPAFSDAIVVDVGFTVCEECLKKIKDLGTFRRLGSIIMSSLLVTEGVLDGVFDVGNLKATDALVPYLIVQEAGGFSFINKRVFLRNERVHLVVARSKDLFDILMDIYDKYVASR